MRHMFTSHVHSSLSVNSHLVQKRLKKSMLHPFHLMTFAGKTMRRSMAVIQIQRLQRQQQSCAVA